jgi:hypothetical protein
MNDDLTGIPGRRLTVHLAFEVLSPYQYANVLDHLASTLSIKIVWLE